MPQDFSAELKPVSGTPPPPLRPGTRPCTQHSHLKNTNVLLLYNKIRKYNISNGSLNLLVIVMDYTVLYLLFFIIICNVTNATTELKKNPNLDQK